MSTRQGWTYAGKHFARTYTPHGGLRHFIDGKPTAKLAWQNDMQTAKNMQSAIIADVPAPCASNTPSNPELLR